ncbi:MAG: hypothetical protein EXQ61_06175 [Ilumatobacteraceae bacterium]|nr:hypothetical protein [Ilumatobacteraceae bacterium]
MASPRFSPVPPDEPVRYYESPDSVPESWSLGRPGEIQGRQPEGERLGYQGPDQGYIIGLAKRASRRVCVTAGEDVDDVLAGCSLIALRRASLFGRAPMVHDLNVALGMWGYLSETPPADLIAVRRDLFVGVGNVAHHYKEGRAIADMAPTTTLKMSPLEVADQYFAHWRSLTGFSA